MKKIIQVELLQMDNSTDTLTFKVKLYNLFIDKLLAGEQIDPNWAELKLPTCTGPTAGAKETERKHQAKQKQAIKHHAKVGYTGEDLAKIKPMDNQHTRNTLTPKSAVRGKEP